MHRDAAQNEIPRIPQEVPTMRLLKAVRYTLVVCSLAAIPAAAFAQQAVLSGSVLDES